MGLFKQCLIPEFMIVPITSTPTVLIIQNEIKQFFLSVILILYYFTFYEYLYIKIMVIFI